MQRQPTKGDEVTPGEPVSHDASGAPAPADAVPSAVNAIAPASEEIGAAATASGLDAPASEPSPTDEGEDVLPVYLDVDEPFDELATAAVEANTTATTGDDEALSTEIDVRGANSSELPRAAVRAVSSWSEAEAENEVAPAAPDFDAASLVDAAPASPPFDGRPGEVFRFVGSMPLPDDAGAGAHDPPTVECQAAPAEAEIDAALGRLPERLLADVREAIASDLNARSFTHEATRRTFFRA